MGKLTLTLLFLLSFSLFITNQAEAQVGIGTTSPNSSAVLDLSSTNKGILVPRMTSSQRTSISSPAKGLMVFDNDSAYFFYYDGSSWQALKNPGAGSTTGFWSRAGSNTILSNSGDNVGVGKTPAYKLDISGPANADSFMISGNTIVSTKGYLNLFLGQGAGSKNSGYYNLFQGYSAGNSNSGSYNTFTGFYAGYKNGYGSQNIFTGPYAGYNNSSGYANIFSGYNAGYNNSNGSNNIFLGQNAGYNNTSGNNNIFTGQNAGYSNTNGGYNIFAGYASGYNNTSGYYNVFTGYGTGYNNTSGAYNIFSGVYAGYSNTTGYSNIFTGIYSGYNNTTGGGNTFLGQYSGYNNTSGGNNIFLGQSSGYNNTSGSQNIFIGAGAGYLNTTGSGNIFNGQSAGSNNTSGSENLFTGFYAGLNNTTGSYNICSGYASGYSNTTGYYNQFSGVEAGFKNTTGYQNTFSGPFAGYNNTSGSLNNFSGMYAGLNNSTGNNNTAVGSYAGDAYNGDNNTFIGTSADANTSGLSNATAIGYQAKVGKSNSLILGATGYYQPNVGIGTTSPDASAILDLSSSSKGLLMPRMNSSQRIYMSSPATGLVVFDTDSGYFFFYNGGWNSMKGTGLGSSTGYWSRSGFATSLSNTSDKVGIGTTNPMLPLDIQRGQSDLMRLVSTTGGVGNKAYLSFLTYNYPGSRAVCARIGTVDMGYNNGSLVFEVADSNAPTTTTTEAMRITNNGNIGVGTATPDQSAMMDMSSTSRGFLMPRMTSSQRTSISSPAAGLEVFDTDSGYVFFYNSGWQGIKSSAAMSPNFWTRGGSKTSLANTGDSVGIGKSPSYKVDVSGPVNADSFMIGGNAVVSTKGTGNTLIGNSAGSQNTGANNTIAGSQAGYKNTSGYYNTFVGGQAGYGNTTGFGNQFFGFQAGASNTTGYYNVFLGLWAGSSNSTGYNNVFTGNFSGESNTTGYSNLFSGYGAGSLNTTGNNNMFSGAYSGYSNTTGSDNSFTGPMTGQNNTTGNYNVYSGYYTGNSNTTGSNNVAEGAFSLYSNKVNGNTGIGTYSGYSNTTGNSNIFIGDSAGVNNTTGSGNTFNGYQAGLGNTSGNNNTFIGKGANCSGTLSNASAIGYNATVSQSNSIVLGATGASQPNVGVGTATPASSALLDLTSTSRGLLIPRMTSGNRTSISSPATGLIVFDTDSGYVFFYNGGWKGLKSDGAISATNYWSRTGTKTTLANSGDKLGVGIAVPLDKLHIDPAGAGGITIGTNGGSGGYTTFGMGISAASNGYSYLQSIRSAGSAWGNIIMNASGGNVGIGKSTAIHGLDVSNGISTDSAMRFTGSGDTTAANEIFFNNNGQIRSADNNHRIIFDRNSQILELREYGDILFSPGSGATSSGRTQKMTIKSGGNVGMGISAPLFPLEIYNAKTDVMRLSNSTGGSGNKTSIAFNTYSSTAAVVARVTAIDGGSFNGALAFEVNGNTTAHNATTTEAMRISTAGNVSIGTTTANGKLTVAGNVAPSADNSYSNGTSGDRWSVVYAANGTIQTSDRRLKENILGLSYGLAEVLKLHPVSYTWIKNPEQGKKVGLIAQEVQKIVPEVVKIGDDSLKTLGMNYAELVPVLINAIQEQQKIIDTQKSSLTKASDRLNAQNASIESQNIRMSKIEAALQSLQPAISASLK